MNKYHNNDQLDTYEAEIIEDIPEQFDLSRYKKSKNSLSNHYRPAANQTYAINYSQANQFNNGLIYQQSQQYTGNSQPDNGFNLNRAIMPLNRLEQNYDSNNYTSLINQPVQTSNLNYQTLPIKSVPQQISNLNVPQQHAHYQMNHPRNLNSNYQYNNNYLMSVQNQANHTTLHRHQAFLNREGYAAQYVPQTVNSNQLYLKSEYESVGSKSKQPNEQIFETYEQKTEFESPKSSRTTSSNRAQSETRKKYSFEDEENDSGLSKKKEYFLKGGDDVPDNKKWIINKPYSEEPVKLSGIFSKSDPDLIQASHVESVSKLNIKSAIKKPGVTFDEKLEVHEVKNPHYGLEIKSEKRELKKKRKDRQKEEDAITKIKLDMKAKIQNQNMILYNVK